MIFDVTGAFIGDLESGKLREDLLQRLPANVGLEKRKGCNESIFTGQLQVEFERLMF